MRLFLQGLVLAFLMLGVMLAVVFSERCQTSPSEEFPAESPH